MFKPFGILVQITFKLRSISTQILLFCSYLDKASPCEEIIDANVADISGRGPFI